ncbi:hypothetical protein ACWD6L_14850 [Micromonospora profundi]|uniref:Uncharacterized protein n=1 Tax=Micromonospora profundi TaxID=1420889 RepID=A0AAJ6HRU1_9ACTN|nr:hypothetical protein [Micromonospora profundi]WLS43450.1 hypothetical protein Q3V37_18790 [Micromonospora profundi]
MTGAADSRLLELHYLLLRVAGWMPDAAVAAARSHLAGRRLAEAADAVLTSTATPRMSLRETDLDLLSTLVPDDRVAAWRTAAAPGAATAPPEPEFAPERSDPTGVTPLVLDLTGAGERMDEPDSAAVDAARGVADGVALWRAWRRDSPDQDQQVPIYLLLVGGDPNGLPAACAQVQDAVARSGVAHPQVEAFHNRTVLPRYQQLARGRSALLWAAADAQPVSTARVFDAYHPTTGGQFSADRPTITDGDEMRRVLDYLDGGAVLLATEARESDPFDEGAGPVVPLSFRTDGRWIWTDAVAYFLRTYALSPDDELLAHIRARDYLVPESDPVAEHRALSSLLS